MEQDFYRSILKEELTRRCEKNPRYSVRAFAKSLGVDVAAISRVLTGKQIPSYQLTQKILSGLDLDPSGQKDFIASVAKKQRKRGLERINPLFKKIKSDIPAQDLSIDYYRVIAEWYHVAIMELTFTKSFKADPKWIASQLGISVLEAKLAIERLVNLHLLEEKKGRLVKTNDRLSTTDKHLTTPALKKNQKQFLEKSIESLEQDPIDERSHTSMTMAIDPKHLPKARELIRNFNQALCDLLETDDQSRVYNLSISLYPLQKGKSV